jgi:hypothetical protein
MNTEKRNKIIEIFRKFSLQRAVRKKMLHDLIEEINDYYETTHVTKEFHEQHLKEQLNGWINHLNELRQNIGGSSDYSNGFKDGINRVITELKNE